MKNLSFKKNKFSFDSILPSIYTEVYIYTYERCVRTT